MAVLEPSSETTPEVVIATRRVTIAPPEGIETEATRWFGRAEATAREIVAHAFADVDPIVLTVRHARLQLPGASGTVGSASATCEPLAGVLRRVAATGETEFDLRVTVANLAGQIIVRVAFRFHIALAYLRPRASG